MVKKYKTAAYHIDSGTGLTQEVISSMDNWLNLWAAKGYVVDKVTEITKNGILAGFFYIFSIEVKDKDDRREESINL